MAQVRKWLTIGVLSILLSNLLSACSGTSGTSETPVKTVGVVAGNVSKPAPSEKQTLYIYAVDDKNFYNDKSTLEKIFGEFEKTYNVDLQFITTKSADQIHKISVAANSNSQIDLMFLNGQYVRTLFTRGLLAPLDHVLKNKDSLFNKSALDAFTFNGKIYAYPYGDSMTSAVYYNKGIFQKYKLTPPVTYEDLVNVTKELNKHGIQGIAFGGASKFMWPMWFFETFFQMSENKGLERTEAVLTGKAKFTDSDYIEAMDALAKFGKDGIFQPGVNGADSELGKALFVAGKAAMFYGGTWELDSFRKSLGGKLGITFFPEVKAGAKVQMTGAGGNAFAMYSNIVPEHKDLAAKLMEYYYSIPIQKILSTQTGVSIPSNKNAPMSTNPLIKELTDNYLPDTSTFLDWYWPQEIVQEFQFQIQAVIRGTVTAEEAMTEIQEVLDKLRENGYNFNE
ncbi:ABC transporter substrate-binding protein [Paenibacillus aestuarii]|uniref:ABC transporter substrate-binding protein n=1 Tax=Paenibacillus aestuarii TaxID=516965 RepID=A0ABW0KG37_9BACL|nr:extracellular solute-binding protein [Paenibacillus aestuarii]